jgi:hypothetical protein
MTEEIEKNLANMDLEQYEQEDSKYNSELIRIDALIFTSELSRLAGGD